MMPQSANEAAFPFVESSDVCQTERIHTGMSLLDYFAAAAMQGILASSYCEDRFANLSENQTQSKVKLEYKRIRLAKAAYAIAADMLYERESRFLDQADDEA